jgi:hypothetical protein
MIDPKRLLADLKRLHAKLKDDLRRHHAASAGRDATEAEWQEAFSTKRTAETFPTFFEAAVDQAAVHWLLAAAFIRFLEDNGLIERPILSGPGERWELARERQQGWFRVRPHDSDAEYLIASFSDAAQFPGLSGLFDAAHNPLFRLPLSGDGAMALIDFFRQRVPETGALDHDFTDPEWGTRWLGDLYQDLSEEARKRYALLQTPDFVEAYILDRTLEPAIREFGFEQVRMIDPAYGSGHFLLGGFGRLLRGWQRHMPDMPPAAQAQRALDGVAGVDLNPFAAEIARFRLLLGALRASGETRLTAAPDFRIQVAAGDSLLHGRHFARHELGGATEGFRRLLSHHFASEDTAELDRILGRQYHAVVGNPPYITPKDLAMRDAYREIYESCYMKYALAAPFIERFFDLAEMGTRGRPAGYVGMIVANSFMKREFGKKLIEDVLPGLDLTHVIDSSGASIPGHSTPTAILFGRNRAPVASVVRAVMGIRGEPGTPDDPAHGEVWSAIVAQTDQAGSTSDFVSVNDLPRATFGQHPWSIAGGVSSAVKETIEAHSPRRLESRIAVRRFTVSIGSRVVTRETQELGFASFPGVDEPFFLNSPTAHRVGIPDPLIRPLVTGEYVRDWTVEPGAAFAPYDSDYHLLPLDLAAPWARHLWRYRACLAGTVSFGGETKADLGAPWWGWYRWIADRYRVRLSITFASVATHNHFALDRGGKVFNRHAPIIKLAHPNSEDDHLAVLGLLNSSVACFWARQTMFPKGGFAAGRWEERLEWDGAKLARFPLAGPPPTDLARSLDEAAQGVVVSLPAAAATQAAPSRQLLDGARAQTDRLHTRMIALQEELDWRCYRLYGLSPDAPEHPNPPAIKLGERAFEIVMARQMAEGELETAWFERHGSTPITEIPAHWPADYREIVERRIALIEANPHIGLSNAPSTSVAGRCLPGRKWSKRRCAAGCSTGWRTGVSGRWTIRACSRRVNLPMPRARTSTSHRWPSFTLVPALTSKPSSPSWHAARPSRSFRRSAIPRMGFASARNGRKPGRSSGARTRSMPKSPPGAMSSF